MFSTLDYQSESIERAALVSLHENCPAETKNALGLELHEVADGLVAIARNDPSVLLNRTLGLGTRVPLTTETLSEVTELYRRAKVKQPFIHIYPHAAPALDTAAFESAQPWRKFDRFASNGTSPARPCSLSVRQVTGDDANDFARLVVPAFGLSDAAFPLLTGLGQDSRWQLFVSYQDDKPIGAGALFVADHVPGADTPTAWFEWEATNPECQRLGSQEAIMRARIAAADAAGCSAMFTERGEAFEGDLQHSYKNIEQYGFHESLLRENWRPRL